MSLTGGQIKALHVAAREAGVSEEDRRTIQRSLGGFHSAADRHAGRYGFIAVMAFYERLCGGKLRHSGYRYWQLEDAKANPTDALVYKAKQLAQALGMTDEQLDDWIAGPRMSSGACDGVDTASAYWLRRAIEGLRAIGRRKKIR